MKPSVFFRNTTFAAFLFFAATSQAQQQPNLQPLAKTEAIAAAATATAPETSTAAKDEVVMDGLKLRNEKMHQHFTAGFKGATNISIYPFAKSTVIYCMVAGVRNNILYTNKGKLQHIIRYYEPGLLPPEVSNIVEADFPGYKMTNVVEVTIAGKTAHLVSVENKKKIMTVRVVQGDSDVYEEHDKQQ